MNDKVQHLRIEPELRFGYFTDSYSKVRFNSLFNFSTGKNIKQAEASPDFKIPCVRYGELYHMYSEVITSIVNRTNLSVEELKFSSGNEILLPSAGEEPLDMGSASALTLPNIAIGRTINILTPKSDDMYEPIYASYYINIKLKHKIAKLAKGVSISNVYNTDLQYLSINLPSIKEQKKIVDTFMTLDKKITLLEDKISNLKLFKKGFIQKFTSDYSKENYIRIREFLIEKKIKSTGKEEVHSVSVHKGIVNQIEHLGRSFSAKDTSNYKQVKYGDIIYTKSPTGDFPYGIIKQNLIEEDIIVSPLYCIYSPVSFEIGYILNDFFESSQNTNNLLYPIVEKGAKNTMNISGERFLDGKIYFNLSDSNIDSLYNGLKVLNKKIRIQNQQLENLKQFKKGLLQQMFI